MHHLHLLRHAKTVVGEGLEDADRPLAKNGRETVRRIGASLPAAVGEIDLVLCSTALRTRETLECALAGFTSRPSVLFEDGLYLASAAALLRRLRRLEESRRAVLVIGHNPGLHELAALLADPASPDYAALAGGKFPTTARASFSIATSWADLERGRQRLVAYVTPKSLGMGE